MEMIEPRTFRATTEAWLGQLLLPMVFFVLLTVTAVNYTGLNPGIASLGLGLLTLIVALDYILPMVRNWMALDSRSIEGSINGRFFHIYWTEVLATWVVDCSRKRYLCVGTAEGTLILPLRFFDDLAIWRMVRSFAPREALEEKAVFKLPDYREWVENHGEVSCLNGEPRAVADHWLIQVICWGGLAFSLLLAMDLFQAGDFPSVALLVGIGAVCLVLLSRWGINEIGPENVTRSTLFGVHSIVWEDVRWIEVDPFDSVIVLVGEETRLRISGPGLWVKTGKNDAMSMLMSQAQTRRIPLRRTLWALLRTSRKPRACK
jgi:hypothetical protein